MKHPYVRALTGLVLSIIIAIPTLVDTHLSVLVPIVGVAAFVAFNSKQAFLSMCISCLLFLVLSLTPYSNELLYLQLRYADTFIPISENEFRATNLGEKIIVDRRYGDTYQAELYRNLILKQVQSRFPSGTTFYSVEYVPVQTRTLYAGWQEYVEAVNPTIYITAKVPKTRQEWTPESVPYNTIIEVIS